VERYRQQSTGGPDQQSDTERTLRFRRREPNGPAQRCVAESAPGRADRAAPCPNAVQRVCAEYHGPTTNSAPLRGLCASQARAMLCWASTGAMTMLRHSYSGTRFRVPTPCSRVWQWRWQWPGGRESLAEAGSGAANVIGTAIRSTCHQREEPRTRLTVEQRVLVSRSPSPVGHRDKDCRFFCQPVHRSAPSGKNATVAFGRGRPVLRRRRDRC
jgi:hypothetical protein